MERPEDGPAGHERLHRGRRGRSTRRGLTPRELEVLALLAASASDQEIAERLGVSAATVKRHVCSVFRKLGTTDRAEAVRRYLVDDLD